MYYLLNLIKCSVKKTITEKNAGKWEKILEKSGKSQGILSVRKSGNPVIPCQTSSREDAPFDIYAEIDVPTVK